MSDLLTLIHPRIDYSDSDAPKTIKVVALNRYNVPMFSVYYNKTEDHNQDWIFSVGTRYYDEGVEGFEARTRDGRFWATVYIPVESIAMTVAEENDPGTLTIAVIHSKRI